MSIRRTLRQIAREWLVALTSYALLVAPFGCEFQAALTDLIPDPGGSGSTTGDSGGTDLDTKSAGLFLNEDTSDPLIVAGRNADGDAFYVYGAREDDGAVGEVESILVKTADGKTSFIVFELGRPVYAEGPDGSYVHITYEEVSPQRFAATAEVYDAVNDATETVTADIEIPEPAELLLAATEAAETIEELTGQKVEVPVAPEEETGKSQDRALGPLLSALVVIPMIFVSHLMVVIMGQIMAAVFEAVSVAIQAAVMAAFMPVFLFAGLLGEVTVRVESVPLVDIFIELPEPPIIDIVIE